MRSLDWRVAVGLALALALLALGAVLVPPYARNLQYQSALAAIARRALESSQPEAETLAEVLWEAERRGLRVQPHQVRIRRAQGRIEITVLYDSMVRLPLYTVDLHFRPRGRAP
ncbi:MAG: hypothetical protein ACUVXB_07985 [Bryobacteraceae bacterium]